MCIFSSKVRIEDDVVIWASGANENLNAQLPRTTDAIEAFMAKRPERYGDE